ncbi:serine/threonine-protein kinase HAL4/sat4 [Dinochytrium kinnereticum]|nr:serine/threonine-protein kinase HAL4/sat4 [Dinochytrium kinnereticum]
MAGTLAQPITIPTGSYRHSTTPAILDRDNEASPELQDSPVSHSEGTDFETIAAIGEEAVQNAQAGSSPDRSHSAFNFFKSHQGDMSSGSGGGHQGHDIFKDLLSNHRHREPPFPAPGPQSNRHGPFNFFKPLHVDCTNGGGSGSGGYQGHDIFKDLLASHRHREEPFQGHAGSHPDRPHSPFHFFKPHHNTDGSHTALGGSNNGSGIFEGSQSHQSHDLFKDLMTNHRHRDEAAYPGHSSPLGQPERPHSPFNFFKPHGDGSNSALGGSNNGSGVFGNQSHDLFKDLLTNHRHRRATSTQPSTSAAESTSGTPERSKSIHRSFSDAGVNDKYRRREEILGKGANAVVRLVKVQKPDGEAKMYAVKSDQWCEVMEYMPGGDLYHRISTQTLTEFDEINCYYKQLLAGVAYIHSMGVAHRDLKPENLLLDAEHRILKIADFGVSEVFKTCFEKSSRKAKGVCGSEPYIAPEEWEEEAEYDGVKVDIWACGIIYYTMHCNSVPWRIAKSQDAYYNDYLNKRRPDQASGFFNFDRLHPGPRSLFYKILEPNPDKRPGAAELLKDEWLSKQEVCQLAEPVVHEINASSVVAPIFPAVEEDGDGEREKVEDPEKGATLAGELHGKLPGERLGVLIAGVPAGSPGVAHSGTPVESPGVTQEGSPIVVVEKKPKLVPVRHVHFVPPSKH